MVEMCALCDDNVPATTNRGLPVCDDCALMLSVIQDDLEAMEAADPELAEKGRRLEESARRFIEAQRRSQN